MRRLDIGSEGGKILTRERVSLVREDERQLALLAARQAETPEVLKEKDEHHEVREV